MSEMYEKPSIISVPFELESACCTGSLQDPQVNLGSNLDIEFGGDL